MAHWTQATLILDTLVDFEVVGLVAGELSTLVFPALYGPFRLTFEHPDSRTMDQIDRFDRRERTQ